MPPTLENKAELEKPPVDYDRAVAMCPYLAHLAMMDGQDAAQQAFLQGMQADHVSLEDRNESAMALLDELDALDAQSELEATTSDDLFGQDSWWNSVDKSSSTSHVSQEQSAVRGRQLEYLANSPSDVDPGPKLDQLSDRNRELQMIRQTVTDAAETSEDPRIEPKLAPQKKALDTTEAVSTVVIKKDAPILTQVDQTVRKVKIVKQVPKPVVNITDKIQPMAATPVKKAVKPSSGVKKPAVAPVTVSQLRRSETIPTIRLPESTPKAAARASRPIKEKLITNEVPKTVIRKERVFKTPLRMVTPDAYKVSTKHITPNDAVDVSKSVEVTVADILAAPEIADEAVSEQSIIEVKHPVIYELESDKLAVETVQDNESDQPNAAVTVQDTFVRKIEDTVEQFENIFAINTESVQQPLKQLIEQLDVIVDVKQPTEMRQDTLVTDAIDTFIDTLVLQIPPEQRLVFKRMIMAELGDDLKQIISVYQSSDKGTHESKMPRVSTLLNDLAVQIQSILGKFAIRQV